jgi:hypothetical protein
MGVIANVVPIAVQVMTKTITTIISQKNSIGIKLKNGLN